LPDSDASRVCSSCFSLNSSSFCYRRGLAVWLWKVAESMALLWFRGLAVVFYMLFWFTKGCG
jgi:hypothetical protein